MKLLNFIIIKLTACLMVGIISAHYLKISFNLGLYLSIGLIGTVFYYYLRLKRKVSTAPFFAVITYCCMVSIGINAYNLQNEQLQPKHYTNLELKGVIDIVFKVKEHLKPDLYNDKYIVSLISANQKVANGKLLLNIKRDTTFNPLPVDCIIYTKSDLSDIQKPLNPHQFDYSNYLQLKQVYKQTYLKPNDILILSEQPTSIYGFADRLRTKVNTELLKAGFQKDVLSIINALLLGQRQTIDQSIYNNYVNSGTIHILAVSGLHVGILLLILNFVFKPLLLLKYGRILRPLIIVFLLWLFAIIAGLSPSVTRAVSMFSLISIAMHLKRPTNIYNTLAISAFLILLVKPTFLFEVGFQMSYLAVLGIVSIQPILYKLWQPKYWIIDKPWQIFTVTLAAQFGVVPISLLYFHQFPGLFFISNLIVIPFLGLILGLGLLVIVLALLNFLPKTLAEIYSLIIESLNGFIAWIAQFEQFLFRDIPFTLLQVICTYAIIISAVQFYKFKTFKWVSLCLISIICLQTTYVYNNVKDKDDTFIVFNKSRFSILGLRAHNKLEVHHNVDSLKLKDDAIIKNYKVGEQIDFVTLDSLQHVYQFKNNTILVMDSLGLYKGLSFHPNLILLRNSPRINLNRVIDSLRPQQIIADASNYKSYVERWKATCRAKKIPFHYTNEKGAFIIK
ncbi:ComEC/Rec2 family competence protein [Winogradskyella aquimaris]|uniref:ComEC/Rec2 family competence protein n=1 Tax=Winogradskyella aquimaris TaxID=864074 RepID=A0ABU5ELS9_9FLAO|nr:ComEC/Rec2 family competence protein [Winogradskyella aquimaris]MDY2587292.1 ComEC/Rec2 family competence protein [Winogradskyella aquimaris]